MRRFQPLPRPTGTNCAAYFSHGRRTGTQLVPQPARFVIRPPSCRLTLVEGRPASGYVHLMRYTRRIHFALPACLFAPSIGIVGVRVGEVVPSVPQASGHRLLYHETVTNNGINDSNRWKLRRHHRAVTPLALGFGLRWANSLTWPAGERRRGIGALSRGQLNSNMTTPSDARHWAPTLRNRDVIAAELCKWLGGGDAVGGGVAAGAGGSAMEIASGTGCHVEAFAKILPTWTFQPTEYDEERIPDLVATKDAGGYKNILHPERLDVCSDPQRWPRPLPPAGAEEGRLWDAMICTNMIHIAPPECTPALLAGAAAGLRMGGRLFIYGPFALSGLLAPESNVKFDQSLKARSNGLWGVKDVSFVADLADERGLDLTAMTAMPANNFFVVFTKAREPESSSDADSGQARSSRVADRISAVVAPAKEALVERLSAAKG